MRLGLAAALVCTALAGAAGALEACGGGAFVTAPADGGGGGGGLSAGGPTGTSGDAAGESFCILEAGTHTFCDDFDGLPLATNWSTIDVAGGGTATTDSLRSYSPPSSFESIAPAALGYSRGRVSKIFGTASKVVVAFELWVDAAPPKLTGSAVAAGDSLVTIEIGPTYSIGLGAHDVVGYFEENTGDGGATQVLSSKQFALETSTLEKAWTEVFVEVDLAHAGLSVTIGGVQELVGALITPPAAGNGTITVVVGCSAHNELSPGLAAHFDNVTIDLTP